MMYLRPSEIRFSQDSISNKFDNPNVFIGDTLDDLIKGQVRITDIPNISVKNVDGNWVSADNRRLWVFKHLELFGKCETIQVIETRYIPPFKHSSKNDGLSVKIRGGGNPGGAAYLVYEKCINDQNSERDEHETRLHAFEMETSNLRDNIIEYKKYLSIYKNTDKEQKAKIDSLSKDIEKMQTRLSDSERIVLETQKRYNNSLVKLNAKTEMLEGVVKSLNTQLANSRQKYSNLVETYRSMEAAYKEKHLELESELNARLRHSQSAIENVESKANIDSLTKQVQKMQSKLAASEEKMAQNQNNYEHSLEKLHKREKTLEDEIKSLNTKLSKSRKNNTAWAEAYKNMETATKEKQVELEFKNECLRKSQSAVEIKESKAKLQSMTLKLEDTEKKYSKLYRLYTSNINTTDKLEKEIETLKEDNTKLKQEMQKSDNRMMEIRRLTYDVGMT